MTEVFHLRENADGLASKKNPTKILPPPTPPQQIKSYCSSLPYSSPWEYSPNTNKPFWSCKWSSFSQNWITTFQSSCGFTIVFWLCWWDLTSSGQFLDDTCSFSCFLCTLLREVYIAIALLVHIFSFLISTVLSSDNACSACLLGVHAAQEVQHDYLESDLCWPSGKTDPFWFQKFLL